MQLFHTPSFPPPPPPPPPPPHSCRPNRILSQLCIVDVMLYMLDNSYTCRLHTTQLATSWIMVLYTVRNTNKSDILSPRTMKLILRLLPLLTVKQDTTELWLDTMYSSDCSTVVVPLVTLISVAKVSGSTLLFLLYPILSAVENSSCAPPEPMYSLLLQERLRDPIAVQVNIT